MKWRFGKYASLTVLSVVLVLLISGVICACPTCPYDWDVEGDSWQEYDSSSHWTVTEWSCAYCGDYWTETSGYSSHTMGFGTGGWVSDGASGCHQEWIEYCYGCPYTYEGQSSTQSHDYEYDSFNYHECSRCGYDQLHNYVYYDAHHDQCTGCGHLDYHNAAPVLDSSPPSITNDATITWSMNDPNNDSLTWHLTIRDGSGNIYEDVPNGTGNSISYNMPDGDWSWDIRITDSEGAYIERNGTVTVDTQPPGVSIDAGVTNDVVWVTVTSDEPVDYIRVGDEYVSEQSHTFTLGGPTNGSATTTIEVVDLAGNSNASDAEWMYPGELTAITYVGGEPIATAGSESDSEIETNDDWTVAPPENVTAKLYNIYGFECASISAEFNWQYDGNTASPISINKVTPTILLGGLGVAHWENIERHMGEPAERTTMEVSAFYELYLETGWVNVHVYSYPVNIGLYIYGTGESIPY